MTKLQGALLTQLVSDIKTDLLALLTHAAVGEDDTVEDSTDTALGMEVFRDALDETDSSQPSEVTATILIGSGEANNNTLREAGLFSTSVLVVDNCDAITSWSDSADMTVSLNNTDFWEGTGSINLTKDGTGSATASTTKAVTSRNFTGRTLSTLLYIADSTVLAQLATTSCLTIRYGSDSSNYYSWVFDKADLAVGKNFIDSLTSANADSTTGTPVLTAMDYYYIAITATGSSEVWSAGKIIMDDLKLLGGSMWARGVLSDFSKVDSVQLYVDFTLSISVTEDTA